jgi:predicted Zn-dependent protease
MHMMIGAGFEELDMAETVSELSSLLVFLKYSRQFERQADEDGLRLMHQSRISCRGLINLFRRLSAMPGMKAAVQWLDSHPDMKDRIAYLATEAGKEKFRERPILRRGEKWTRIKKY